MTVYGCDEQISRTKENPDGSSLEAKFGFDDRRFRDPRLTEAYLEVEQADGTRATESIDDGNVTYGVSIPSNEVKLDIDELNSQMRVELPKETRTTYDFIVSPTELSSERKEAELRTPEYGIHKCTYISEIEDGQAYIGIRGFRTGNESDDTRSETERILEHYGFDEDIVPTVQEI